MSRTQSARRLRWVLAAAFAVSLLALPTAGADPAFYQGPIFGISTAADGSLLVANAGQGVVKVTGGVPSLVTPLPGVGDVAPASGGGLWAITSGDPGAQLLYRIADDGSKRVVASLYDYEAKYDPHPGDINSNPFDVADLGGGEALVADAGGNDLLVVNKHGKVKLVAVLPDRLVSTANIKTLAGCPASNADFCNLPPMMPAEPVATSVAVGPDGAFYVGELTGFPAPTGFSRVWRIEPNARNARCGQSPLCRVVVDGRTSIMDIAFGPDGKLYVAQFDDASWAAVEIFGGNGAQGGSVRRCDVATGACTTVVAHVPLLTSITFDGQGHLWGAVNVFAAADVVQLSP